MMIRQKMRAKRCLAHLRGVVDASPRTTQSWRAVKLPTHAVVNKPTHLTLRVAPSPIPVATSQNHHEASKAREGPSSCWLEKQVKAKAVSAVQNTNGESNRISRDWVTSAFSKMTSVAPRAEVMVLHPIARNVRNIMGIVAIPITAGNIRMAT